MVDCALSVERQWSLIWILAHIPVGAITCDPSGASLGAEASSMLFDAGVWKLLMLCEDILVTVWAGECCCGMEEVRRLKGLVGFSKQTAEHTEMEKFIE